MPLDSEAVELLGLESELTAQGIESAFVPFRPGEGFSYTRSISQPIRLMVTEGDLLRAREVATALGCGDLLVPPSLA